MRRLPVTVQGGCAGCRSGRLLLQHSVAASAACALLCCCCCCVTCAGCSPRGELTECLHVLAVAQEAPTPMLKLGLAGRPIDACTPTVCYSEMHRVSHVCLLDDLLPAHALPTALLGTASSLQHCQEHHQWPEESPCPPGSGLFPAQLPFCCSGCCPPCKRRVCVGGTGT